MYRRLKRASGRLPVIPASWMNSASCTRSRLCSIPTSAEPHSVRSSSNSSSTRTIGFGFFPVFSRNSSTSLCCTYLALDISRFSPRHRWGVRTPCHSLLVSKSMTEHPVSFRRTRPNVFQYVCRVLAARSESLLSCSN